MSHTIANLEHHHFKYGLFCQPGDVHVHMFGTATLSFADGIKPEAGDVFEIEARRFRPAAAQSAGRLPRDRTRDAERRRRVARSDRGRKA